MRRDGEGAAMRGEQSTHIDIVLYMYVKGMRVGGGAGGGSASYVVEVRPKR